MKKLIADFKAFAVKGNMIDIAIGVIIGTAFNKVVDVLVKNILMPPLALLTNGVNWENKKIILREKVMAGEVVELEEIAIGYGKLIDASTEFLVITLTIFVVIKLMSRMRKKAENPKDTTVPTPKDIELLSEVTVLLKRQNELLENQNPKQDPT